MPSPSKTYSFKICGPISTTRYSVLKCVVEFASWECLCGMCGEHKREISTKGGWGRDQGLGHQSVGIPTSLFPRLGEELLFNDFPLIAVDFHKS